MLAPHKQMRCANPIPNKPQLHIPTLLCFCAPYTMPVVLDMSLTCRNVASVDKPNAVSCQELPLVFPHVALACFATTEYESNTGNFWLGRFHLAGDACAVRSLHIMWCLLDVNCEMNMICNPPIDHSWPLDPAVPHTALSCDCSSAKYDYSTVNWCFCLLFTLWFHHPPSCQQNYLPADNTATSWAFWVSLKSDMVKGSFSASVAGAFIWRNTVIMLGISAHSFITSEGQSDDFTVPILYGSHTMNGLRDNYQKLIDQLEADIWWPIT